MRAMPNSLHRTADTGASTLADESVGLDTLARRYRSALLRYFQHNLGHPEDAEDLTQEVFARFAQIDPPPAITNHEAYLLRIASNLLRDRFRRNQTHHVFQHLSVGECADELLGEAPSEERVYEEQERLRTFLRALDELPPRCHEVFLLQRYEGMTYSAIAQRLGISVSAVEKHMMKALLHLSTQLEPT